MHAVLFLNVFTTNVFAVGNNVTAALNVARCARADDLDTTHPPSCTFIQKSSQPIKNGWLCISEARAVGLIAQAIAKNRI